MLNLFLLLTIFIFFTSIVAIFIAVLIFNKKEPHKELKEKLLNYLQTNIN